MELARQAERERRRAEVCACARARVRWRCRTEPAGPARPDGRVLVQSPPEVGIDSAHTRVPAQALLRGTVAVQD